MPSYSQQNLNDAVKARISKNYTDANFLLIANQAIRELLEIDLRSSIRKVALSPNLLNDVYQYVLSSDTKSNKIIDIKPQINRGRYDDWILTTPEEFDRRKTDRRYDSAGDAIENSMADSLIAISRDDLVNKLLVSKQIDDTETIVDTLDAIGDWVLFGDGTNLTADADNYVKGSASINWDINADGGTTAGIQNTSLDEFDVSDYLTAGYVFAWVYISNVDDVTNFICRIGSSTSNYYSITITTNSEGNSFHTGWNLLRFSFTNKSETGTVDDDACDYIALYMTKDAGKTSETDFRFDHIILKIGDHYDVIYYSRYLWQSSAGTYLEDATDVTDLINCETDEYALVILKTCELMERHLKNRSEANEHLALYEKARKRYIKENPSQSLVMISEYHTFDN